MPLPQVISILPSLKERMRDDDVMTLLDEAGSMVLQVEKPTKIVEVFFEKPPSEWQRITTANETARTPANMQCPERVPVALRMSCNGQSRVLTKGQHFCMQTVNTSVDY